MLYQAANLLVLVYNIYLLKRSMWIHDVGCKCSRKSSWQEQHANMPTSVFLSVSTFLVLIITSLARTSPKYQPAEVVWTTFLNQSGWNNGVAFLTGLVNPNYMYAGIDGAIHLAEECKNASVVVPRALMSTITIGFITSWVFAIVMLYCTQDFDAAATTPTGYVMIMLARSNS